MPTEMPHPLLRPLRPFLLVLLVLCCLTLFTPAVRAEESATALIDTISRLQNKGEIRVGIPPYNTPPFYYRESEQGPFKGYDIEIARTIARRLGVRLVLDRQSTSFNDLVTRAGRGEVDLAIGKLGTTYSRLFDADPHGYMNFRQALLIDRRVLSRIGQETDPKLGQKLKQAPLRLGAIRNSAYDTYAVEVFPRAEVSALPSWDAVVQALRSGHVDAIYRDYTEIRMLTLQNPSIALHYAPILIEDLADKKSIYVGQQSRDLGPFLDYLISSEFGIVDDDAIIRRFRTFYRRQS